MSETLEKPLEGLREGTNRILKEDTAIHYSFEYVFRLLLVYFYTRKGTVEVIKDDDRAAFDGMCLGALESIINAIASDKGIELGDEEGNRFASLASKALTGYLKSSMKGDPGTIAHELASSFDEELKAKGLWGKALPYTAIYAEERE